MESNRGTSDPRRRDRASCTLGKSANLRTLPRTAPGASRNDTCVRRSVATLTPAEKHGTPRQVAVAVAVQLDEQAPSGTAKVCIVTSRKHDDSWVLPKGGVEKGESAREAAARELWEEGACSVTRRTY